MLKRMRCDQSNMTISLEITQIAETQKLRTEIKDIYAIKVVIDRNIMFEKL